MSETKKEKREVQIGSRFGILTVIDTTDERKNRYMVYRCRCDCGKEILVDKRKLQRGTAKDCGCNSVKGYTDLRGRKFGKLTVLSQLDKKSGAGWYWLCKCDCGGMTEAPSRQLLSGYKKSCGCLHSKKIKDFVGKSFGLLTVIEYAGKSSGVHHWKCKCDCGNETIVGQTNLQRGWTQSCGCLKKSACKKSLKLVDDTSVVILERRRICSISSNTSGQTGVYRNHRTGKWVAEIGFKRKTYYLGSYDSFADAVTARKRGEEMWEAFLENYYKNRKDEK